MARAERRMTEAMAGLLRALVRIDWRGSWLLVRGNEIASARALERRRLARIRCDVDGTWLCATARGVSALAAHERAGRESETTTVARGLALAAYCGAEQRTSTRRRGRWVSGHGGLASSVQPSSRRRGTGRSRRRCASRLASPPQFSDSADLLERGVLVGEAAGKLREQRPRREQGKAVKRDQSIAFLRSLGAGNEGATIYQDVIDDVLAALDDCERDREAATARLAVVSRREAELHYAIRRDANILDHKLTEEEAHRVALDRAEKMWAELEMMHALAGKEKP